MANYDVGQEINRFLGRVRLRKLLGVLLLFSCLFWLTAGYAEEAEVTSGQASDTTHQVEKKPEKSEGHGISVFLLVFIGAILFVISTATALNALGGKPPPRSGSGTTTKPRKSSSEDPKGRFRL
jgi:hypothetical protein